MILLKLKLVYKYLTFLISIYTYIKAIAGWGFAHAATILQIQLAHARTLHLN